MKYIRIIPRLENKGPNLVKEGNYLKGYRVLGKPGDFSQLYYKQGAERGWHPLIWALVLGLKETVATTY